MKNHTITNKQKVDYNRMLETLNEIANGYLSVERLKKESIKLYGLEYEEALEMAYENIKGQAKKAIYYVKKL